VVPFIDGKLLKEILAGGLDATSLDNVDAKLIDFVDPIVHAVGRIYFRSTVAGIERVPPGGAMIVGNHNAGITFLEPFVMGQRWYQTHGVDDDPLYFVAHDAMVAIPVVKNVLMKLGAVRATLANSEKILDTGHKMVVFPGGNHEAFRPYSQKAEVDFGGHKGFARLALDRNVPIVPMANVGGHETFFVMRRGEKLSALLGVDKLLRSKSCPLGFALPFGLYFGPIFHLPLPAKFEIELGEPIHPAEAVADVPPEERVDALYDLVTGAIQSMVARIYARRKYPIIG
jgi:1-acyl-sn-glycerol-3-phosphate acyltransferase